MNWLPFAGEVMDSIGAGLFSSHSAAKAAERQRDLWTYMQSNAHQLEVEDLRKAGLNPILSASHGQMASMPSVTSAGGLSSDLGGSINTGQSLSLLRKQLEANIRQKDAEIRLGKQNAMTAWVDAETRRKNATIAQGRLDFEKDMANKQFGLNEWTSANQIRINEGHLAVARDNVAGVLRQIDKENEFTDSKIRELATVIRKNILTADITEYERDNLLGELGGLMRKLQIADYKERLTVLKNSPELYRAGYLGKLLNPLLPSVNLGWHYSGKGGK